MDSKNLFFILLLVCINAAFCQSFDAKDSYKRLCNYEKVELKKVSELKEVIKAAKGASKDDKCPTTVRDSILLMKQALDIVDNESCTEEHVKRISNYHLKHLSAANLTPINLPESLKHFFAGYSLSVNKLCRENLAHHLLNDSRKLLTEEDYKGMEDYIGKDNGNPFKALLDLIMDKILELNLDVATENKATTDTELVYMQSPNGEQIKKIQSLCGRRFRPLYERLITPSVSLANLGYKYKEAAPLEPETSSLLRRWNRIVYVCESLRDIVIVDNPEADGEIKTWTKTEARELEEKFGRKEPESDGREQIEYRVSDDAQGIDEVLVGPDVERIVQNLEKQAEKYNRSRMPKMPNPPNEFLRRLFDRRPQKDQTARRESMLDLYYNEPLESYF